MSMGVNLSRLILTVLRFRLFPSAVLVFTRVSRMFCPSWGFPVLLLKSRLFQCHGPIHLVARGGEHTSFLLDLLLTCSYETWSSEASRVSPHVLRIFPFYFCFYANGGQSLQIPFHYEPLCSIRQFSVVVSLRCINPVILLRTIAIKPRNKAIFITLSLASFSFLDIYWASRFLFTIFLQKNSLRIKRV